MTRANVVSLATLQSALERGLPVQGRSESSACRLKVSKLVPYIAVAPYSGVHARRAVARLIALDSRKRLRAEEAATDRLVSAAPVYVAALDSRLEYDLDAAVERAIPTAPGAYREPAHEEVARESLGRWREVHGALEEIVRAILARYGACLVFEVVSPPNRKSSRADFDVATSHLDEADRRRFDAEIEAWKAALGHVHGERRRIEVAENAGLARAGEIARRLRALSSNVLVLPTAVRRFYRDDRARAVYPDVVRRLRRDLARAMARVATGFARARTTWRPRHSAALRSGEVPEVALEVDRALVDVARQLTLLRYINPVNAESERQRFLAQKGEVAPRFRYRPLEFEPAVLKRRLYQVPIHQIEDPELERLYSAKRRELDQKIDLLAERGQADFLLTSIKLYGRPDEPGFADARALVRMEAPPELRDLSARDVKRRLETEVAAYQEQDARFRCRIRVKRGLASRAVTLQGRVELRAEARFSSRLAEGLAHHEVGVHALTTHNGGRQPLGILRYGLPRARRTQEGLAIFAEFRAGALTPARFRTLGLRALLVGSLLEGATFVDAVRFVREQGLELDDAWELVFRIYRGGGLTKDGVYLTGFLEVVRYWLSGRDLSTLVAGKVAVEHAAVVRDLIARGVLARPTLLPRFLLDEAGLAAGRLVFGLVDARGRDGISLRDVLGATTPGPS